MVERILFEDWLVIDRPYFYKRILDWNSKISLSIGLFEPFILIISFYWSVIRYYFSQKGVN